ncbi:MAG: KH domain-containing protein [Anaerolineales bacterium]|nr:KH domain-containing protein [Anaerolineales bacterium]HEY62757.1 KH domain-containing protein [Anaerolineae bacterium]
MQELIEYIARSLVDDPTQVRVSQQRSGDNVQIRLHVAQEDMGRVIGRNGRVANAMRVLLRVAAAHDGSRAVLDIAEPR